MAKGKILALFLLISALAACTTRESPPKVPAEQQSTLMGTQEVSSPAKAGWEEEWSRVLAGAKKEGKVIVYTTVGKEVPTALIPALREKYGITAEFSTGKGAEIGLKLTTERKAGLKLVDVYIGGATTQVNQLKPAGVLAVTEEALILPEVKDPKVWWGGSLLWIDDERLSLAFLAHPISAYAINTTMVKPEEVKAYRDLLDPKWKGKILLNDPTLAGVGEQGMSFVLGTLGVDFLKDLAKQEPVIVRDQRLQIEWLARGKYPVTLFCKPEPFAEFVNVGAPIKELIPAEGMALTGGAGNLSLIEGAPHPNAARVLINWLLTRETQILYQKTVLVPSAREDIPSDYLKPENMRLPGVKYEWVNTEKRLLLMGGEHRKIINEIFGPLIK